MKKRWLLLLIPIVLVLTFIIWAKGSYQAMEVAELALRSNEIVTVRTDSTFHFQPQGRSTETGFIFYPGGKVEPKAYAPLARAVAERGYPTLIIPMPLNLAVLDYQAASEVLEQHPEVTRWVIGGHSLGGAMAAHYVHKYPDQMAGLVLLAAYPPSKDDLSSYQGAVLSIFGSKDGMATPEKVGASRENLPSDTKWLEIEGGNHSQFGWYGFQKGDYPADLSREEQQAIIVEAITQLLESVDRRTLFHGKDIPGK